jgi:tetratricopeptide (TPR) repeat protein
MQAERDALVKHVFPRLRALCEERGINWGEVDLRWGIKEEDRLDGRVLPICFEQIDACRPYFIGLLGARYGSRVAIPEALLAQHQWLASHHDCSVTELEFRYAAFHSPEASPRSFFYLRSSDLAAAGVDESPRDRAASERLTKLRADIQRSGLPVSEFPTTQRLSERVHEQLSASIEQDFPALGRDTGIEQEIARQVSFSESRARIFTGRAEYLEALDRHVEGTGPPLVLSGPSGVGKSALLAAWLERRSSSWQERHPDGRIAAYFVGASSEGSGWRRLAETVLAQLGAPPARPTTGEELRHELLVNFDRLGSEGGAVIVLDAVNQLDPAEAALELLWLPPELHPQVRLIVSTTEGTSADECRRRNWSETPLGMPEPAECRQLAIDFLSQRYGKELTQSDQDLLLGNPLSGMALWLTAVLEELRLFGEYASFGRYLAAYASTSSIGELFARILERWERDYGGSHTTMVTDALAAIWASRRGLTEVELREHLASTGQLTSLDWTIFVAAASGFLADRAGLFNLSHIHLRQAVERRYLPDAAEQRALHRKLAALFEGCPDGLRRRSELPWQWQRAGELSALRSLLCQRDFIRSAWQEDPNEVGAFWTNVESAGLESRAHAYTPLLAEPEQELTLVGVVADVLSSAGFNRESLALYERTLARIDHENLPLQAAQATLGAARLNGVLGMPEKALLGFSQAEAAFRKIGSKSELLVCLGERANALLGRGDLKEALSNFEEAAALARDLDDLASLQSIHIGRSEILRLRGSLTETAAELVEAERLAKVLGDRSALERAYGSWAGLCDALRDYAKMLEYAEKRIAISAGLGDRAALASGLVEKALAIVRYQRLDEAKELYERAASLYDAVGDISRAADVRVNLAVLLARRFRQGDTNRAAMVELGIQMLEEQLKVYQSIGERSSVGTCLSSLGVMRIERGELELGLALLREAIEAETAAGRLFTAAGMQVDVADSLLDVNRTAEACELLKLALRYHLQHDAVAWAVSRTLTALSRAYAQLGRPEDATDNALLAEQWAIRADLPEFIADAIGQQARLLEDSGDHRGAVPQRQREVNVRTEGAQGQAIAGSYRALHRAAAQAAYWDVAIEALAAQWNIEGELGDRRQLEAEIRAAVSALQDAEPGGAAYVYREALGRIVDGSYTEEWLRVAIEEFGVPAEVEHCG